MFSSEFRTPSESDIAASTGSGHLPEQSAAVRDILNRQGGEDFSQAWDRELQEVREQQGKPFVYLREYLRYVKCLTYITGNSL